MTYRAMSALILLIPLLGNLGCSRPAATSSSRPISAETPKGFSFQSQDLPFRYDRGETGAAWPVEVTGGGVGFLDYDGDGDYDLFFCQGGPLISADRKRSRSASDVLLRNDGRRAFTDVSAAVGLSDKGYGQGVTIADYDGDGDPDIYVTRYGGNTLWRNDGGKLVDVTSDAKVGCGLWSLGAAFLDYDGDGDLDLFVANYLTFDASAAPFAHDEEGNVDYGAPSTFIGQPDVLYRNEGDGTFTDVSALAGIAGSGRGMGCLAGDFDLDGKMDILVANDAEANALWRNKGDGTFEDVAFPWGLAYNGEGRHEANMGIARGDTRSEGKLDVLITHFYNEHATLWHPEVVDLPGGGVTFLDVTYEAGLAPASRPTTGWGVAFVDFDRDGALDAIAVNGQIRRVKSLLYPYDNPAILWRNIGKGVFRDVAPRSGPYFSALHQSRGLAVGDLDSDGRPDVVVVHHHSPSVVLWNETEPKGHALRLALQGRGSNRDAIGARLTARAGGKTYVAQVESGGSYLSSSAPVIDLGLGAIGEIESVTVQWPSGRVETRQNVPVDRVLKWIEGEPSATVRDTPGK